MSYTKRYLEANCDYKDGEFVFNDGYGDNPPEDIFNQRLIKAGLQPVENQQTPKYAYTFNCTSDPNGVAHISLYIYRHNPNGNVINVKCYGDAALRHAKFLMGNSYFNNQQYLEKLYLQVLRQESPSSFKPF
jgi:hypothetical protein